jgi:hypothetical protein
MPAKKTVKKPSARSNKTAGKGPSARRKDVFYADPALFAPLSVGERSDAVRVLSEDNRLANMVKIGRYRVIAAEPLAVKPPHPDAGSRLARVVCFDYAASKSVEATVNLDSSCVIDITISDAQPMLSLEEENTAVAIALTDENIGDRLSLGDEPVAVMHYWSDRQADLAHSRRSAAVLFGRPGRPPSWVAVVDLVDQSITEFVTAANW